MKNNLLTIAVLLSGCLAQANLTQECHEQMEKMAPSYFHIQALADSGEISSAEKAIHFNMQSLAVKAVALSCAGRAEIEMENSLQARLGLLTEKTAQEKSAKFYNALITYYDQLTNQYGEQNVSLK